MVVGTLSAIVITVNISSRTTPDESNKRPPGSQQMTVLFEYSGVVCIWVVILYSVYVGATIGSFVWYWTTTRNIAAIEHLSNVSIMALSIFLCDALVSLVEVGGPTAEGRLQQRYRQLKGLFRIGSA